MLIEERLVQLLNEKNMTITTAESCTGGMISSTIVNVSGASNVLNEAYVTYANEAKMNLLGVSEVNLNNYGAVSYEVAYEMVEGVAKRANADCAIAVTGIAGPDGGTEEKPVGTVFAGYYLMGEIYVEKYLFDGDRLNVRTKTTNTVLEHMVELINDKKI